MSFNPIESLGGWCRCATLMVAFLHFLHTLFCVTTYIYWVKDQEKVLGHALVTAYLGMVVIACVFYLFVASVFYMWAWRFPEPEEVAKRRRIYGVTVNLLFCDIPLFVIEAKIVWQVKFVNGVQGFTFCLTCISIFYSIVRVWTFFMVKIIKVRAPISTSYPRFSLTQPYQERRSQYDTSSGNERGDEYSTEYTPAARGTRRAQEMGQFSDGPSVSRYYYDEDEAPYSSAERRSAPDSPEMDQYTQESPGMTRRRV